MKLVRALSATALFCASLSACIVNGDFTDPDLDSRGGTANNAGRAGSVAKGGSRSSGGSTSSGGTTNSSGGSSAGQTSSGGGDSAGDAGEGNGSGGSAGEGNGSGGVGGTSAGTGGNAGAGTGGSAGAGTGGTAGKGGSSGSGGSGGSAGTTGDPLSISVTSRSLAVPSGSVFNIVDNFFNDGFLPASPVANFGFHNPVISYVNADGSLDVAWLDYTGGKSAPFALPAAGLINVTHIDAGLTTATTKSTGIRSFKLLGFTGDGAGGFFIAYNVNHPFRSSGGENDLNGNELHIAKFSDSSFATKAWDTLVFGNQDNNKDLSKGDPGGAGSGVLGYDSTNKKLALYVAHSMAWGDGGVRHQAGYFRLFDPATGKMQNPGRGAAANMNSAWFYSHNFNQRMIIDNGIFYVLAHGDAYERQLGFAARSLSSYTNDDATTFDRSYFTISGSQGDNNTNAETGQFVKLSSGNFAIVHTTSQGRTMRDVRIVTAKSSDGTQVAEAWLTNNTGKIMATIPKLERMGDRIMVSYGLWDSTSRTNKKIDWYVLLVDQNLKVLNSPKNITGVEFIPGLPSFRFPGGPNAGRIGWVSGNASHTLSVHVAKTGN
jgi:hypothetical protein